jgi:ribonuclease T1
MSRRFTFRALAVGALSAMCALSLSACGGSTVTLDRPATSTLVPSPGTANGSAKTGSTRPTSPTKPGTPTTKASSKPSTTRGPRDLISADAPLTDLDTISLDQLPDEAIDTLTLIASDGPFPYSKDGVTFQNRERILPKQARSYYHEYTVETPGSSDRGARRIITGDGGERFYTDDHYDSFKEIVP